MSERIDFVVPWVDDSDKRWLALKSQWQTKEESGDSAANGTTRYRDWGTLKYWFRGVEKFAPWVNKIFFVTNGQVPDFLNLEHPKLRFVRHDEYIPSEWLPTFSANPIELNLHRIPDLSENFVYFNDDMFIVAPVAADDFFRGGLPCDQGVLGVLTPWKGNTPTAYHWTLNGIYYINQHFDKKSAIEQNRDKWFSPVYGSLQERTDRLDYWNCFTGFYTPHIQQSFLKSTFETVWRSEPEVLKRTCSHKFRTSLDVNQYLMKYWQLAEGKFSPYPKSGQYFSLQSDDIKKIREDIEKKGYKTACLNDAYEDISQEQLEKKDRELLAYFEELLPDKCTFER